MLHPSLQPETCTLELWFVAERVPVIVISRIDSLASKQNTIDCNMLRSPLFHILGLKIMTRSKVFAITDTKWGDLKVSMINGVNFYDSDSDSDKDVRCKDSKLEAEHTEIPFRWTWKTRNFSLNSPRLKNKFQVVLFGVIVSLRADASRLYSTAILLTRQTISLCLPVSSFLFANKLHHFVRTNPTWIFRLLPHVAQPPNQTFRV